MRRLVIAALGTAAALAALAHCGGTTGNNAIPSPALGATSDATVEGAAPEGPLDAGSDQSVYTNTFDVAIQYADQELPEVQPPAESGAGATEAGLGVPDCPPFIYLDDKGNQLPATTCVPISGCSSQTYTVPADWSGDGGEITARDGGACATYPWLGSLTTDDLVVSNNYEDFNLMPPCNWAREAGAATQGSMIGASRYDLCIEAYECYMRTHCFLNENSSGTAFVPSALPCLCPISGSFSATACVNDKGPCYDSIAAAMEAPVDPNNPTATAAYVSMVWSQEHGPNGAVGVEGIILNQMFADAIPYFPRCAIDAGLDCDQ